jgi:hypothetical protein
LDSIKKPALGLSTIYQSRAKFHTKFKKHTETVLHSVHFVEYVYLTNTTLRKLTPETPLILYIYEGDPKITGI